MTYKRIPSTKEFNEWSKNTVETFSSVLDHAEERIIKLKDRSFEITQSDIQERKREREREKEKGREGGRKEKKQKKKITNAGEDTEKCSYAVGENVK